MERRIWAVVAMTAGADWLFYGHDLGVSLALYGLGVMGVVLAVRGGRVTRVDGAVLGVVALCLLPVVEKVQILSVAFLVGGVVAGAAALWHGPRGRWGVAAVRLLISVPWQGPVDAWAMRGRAMPAVAWRAWVMPGVAAAMFAGLMAAGNPVLEAWALDLTTWPADSAGIAQRVVFWVLMAMLVWPLLVAGRDADWLGPAQVRGSLPWAALGFTRASVARALVLFNVMFAVQTGLDAAYLWGGATLPDGMTHAEYAHRGAYPLLATAVLAGLFALASRPFLGDGRVIRALLILWLGQNVLLVASSLLRLEMYVAAYGLTYLRIAAGIWMGLVATGLVLVAWQVWVGRSNRWLIGVNTGVGLAVVYACCFVNFATLIADDGRARIAAGLRVDMAYLCDLGPDAAGRLPLRCGRVDPPVTTDWRDWGFRTARIQGRFAPQTGPDE